LFGWTVVDPLAGEIPSIHMTEQLIPHIIDSTYTHAVFQVVVLGLIVWVIKGYISEKTRKRKAGEQLLTSDEIAAVVGQAMENQRNLCFAKIDNFILATEDRLKQDKKDLQDLSQSINTLNTNVAVLTTVIDKNGFKKALK
jgi:hypothetical protein